MTQALAVSLLVLCFARRKSSFSPTGTLRCQDLAKARLQTSALTVGLALWRRRSSAMSLPCSSAPEGLLYYRMAQKKTGLKNQGFLKLLALPANLTWCKVPLVTPWRERDRQREREGRLLLGGHVRGHVARRRRRGCRGGGCRWGGPRQVAQATPHWGGRQQRGATPSEPNPRLRALVMRSPETVNKGAVKT